MTAQGWPGKLVQISASVHRLHGREDSPFMPEGRSTDTSVVDQVQRVSPSVNHPQVPTLMLETARWPLSRPQELDLCDTWCTQPLLSPSGYTIVLVTRNTLRLDHGYGEKPELSLVSPGFLFLHSVFVCSSEWRWGLMSCLATQMGLRLF